MVSGCKIEKDPGTWPPKISDSMRSYFHEIGSCQPSSLELTDGFPKVFDVSKKARSFHESYYNKVLFDGTVVRRSWLSYSVSLNRVFCITCKIFGLPKALRSSFASEGNQDFHNIKRNIEKHETAIEHLQAEISRGLYANNNRIDAQIVHSANRKVCENREILKVIIDVLLYLARQNIAFRGHDESFLSINQGNFLELVKVISQYHPIMQQHLDKIQNKKKNRLTYMSHDTQNCLLKILAEQIRLKILKEVQKAGLFAIIIDTTTDVAKLEQMCFVVRYINEEGQIQERLIALHTTLDASGLGMFNVFLSVTEKYQINWKTQLCAQAYDGAASMQGQYSGLRTRIQQENPNALYIWCFAHQLNLVIVDMCDCSTETKVFLGDVQSVNDFMRARKRTAIFVEYQKELYPSMRLRRLKHFSTTRWTSHDRAIIVIHEKFKALIKTLNHLSSSPDSDRDTSSTATSLAITVSSFKFVVTMLFTQKIFSITTPLSKYLQSKSLDFIQAVVLIDEVKENLINLRTDREFLKLINEARQFAKENDLVETEFKEIRVRKKKLMPGEVSHDEPQILAIDRYKSTVYFTVLDNILTSISNRFKESREILKDLSILSPARIKSFGKESSPNLPSDAFQELCRWLPNIDLLALKNEYLTFSKSINGLIDGMSPNLLHKNKTTFLFESNQDSDIDEPFIDSEEENTDNSTEIDTKKLLEVLTNFGILHSFPNLHYAYKALLTIPTSSASAERAFSKVSNCFIIY